MTDFHGRIMNTQGRCASMIVGSVSSYSQGYKEARHAAAEIASEADTEIARLRAERDEAYRRRDAWKERAENHVEIQDALKAKTKGGDSRTLGRALIGAAKMNLESENERLRAEIERYQSVCWHIFHIGNDGGGIDDPQWTGARWIDNSELEEAWDSARAALKESDQ